MVIPRVIMPIAVFVESFSAASALVLFVVSGDGLADIPCANSAKIIMMLLLFYVQNVLINYYILAHQNIIRNLKIKLLRVLMCAILLMCLYCLCALYVWHNLALSRR